MEIIVYSFASFLLTFLLIGKFKDILIKFLPDIPNHRSDHNKVVTRAGGVVIFTVFSIISYFYGIKNMIFFIPLVSISFLDDYLNISNLKRIIFQFLTILFIYYNSNIYSIIVNNLNPLSHIISFFLVAIFGLSIINLCNFMDGIDGLLAGNIIIIFIFCALRFDISTFILIGSLFGFLYWNWEPAKVFMGDVGSTFLGAYLVSIFFNLNESSNFITLLLICFPILGDAISCLIIRLCNGKNIFKAHKDHLYQRLRKNGWKSKNITLTYMTFTFLNIFSFLTFGLITSFVSSLFTIAFGFFLHKKYASKLFS